jgi:O-antigen/teichoic acid export membrane protein
MLKKFKKKLGNDGSRNAKNSLICGIGTAIPALSLLILTPLLLIKLGKDGMGIVTLYSIILGLSGAVNFGMGQATLKYVSKYRALKRLDRISSIISTTLTFYFIISTLLGITAFFCARLFVDHIFKIPPELEAEALLAFQLTALGMIFALCNEVATSSLKGFERFDLAVGVDVVIRLLTVLLQVVVLLDGQGLVSVVIVMVSCQGLGILTRLAILNSKVFPDLKLTLRIDRESFRETFSFGIYTWVASLIYRLRTAAPSLLLAIFVGPGAVAIYRIAERVLTQVTSVLGAMTSYLFPLISQQFELLKTEQMHKHYISTTQNFVILSAMGMTPLAICSAPFIAMWISPEIANEVAPILMILAVRYALIPLASINFAFIAATNNTKALVRLQIIAALVILPASYFGVMWWGITGLAWAQLAVYGTLVINRLYIEKKLFGSALVKMQFLMILALVLPIGGFTLIAPLPISAGWISMLLWGMGSSLLAGALAWLVVVAIPSRSLGMRRSILDA